MLKDIERISQDILSKRVEAASMDFQNRELDHFKKQYKEYGSSLESINQSFVDIKNPVNFIEFLEEAAADLTIDFDINLNVAPRKEGSDNQPVAVFQVFAKGAFPNVLAFSEKMEKGPYLINVKSLSVKKTEKGVLSKADTSNTVDASFLIEAVSR